MEIFSGFSGLYKLTKTLRSELIPIGKTLENIVKSGILEKDEHRAESYKKVKKIIDEYHKDFIDRVLSDFKLKVENNMREDSLEEFLLWYNDKGEKRNKKLASIQKSLREQIAKHLKADVRYKRIFKSDLIKKDLIDFLKGKVEEEEKRALVEEFKNFTSYFTGFHQNRENMYSSEEESTAIAYRLVHDNLPKFVDNIQNFEKVKDKIADQIKMLYSNMEEYLNVVEIAEMFQMDYYNMVLTQTQIDVYNAIIGGKSLDDGTKIQGLNEYINLYNQHHRDEPRLPKLKLLFKQILSDRNAISWLPENFDSDQEVLAAIQEFYKSLGTHILSDDEASLKSLLKGLTEGKYSLKGVYIRNDVQLTDISQKKYGDWGKISKAIRADVESIRPQRKKESYEAWQESISKIINASKSFSVQYINDTMRTADAEAEGVDRHFAALGANGQEEGNLFDRVARAYDDARELLENPYPKDKNLIQDKANVKKIKTLLDAVKDLQHFVKPLAGSGDEPDKDGAFYGEYAALWSELDEVTPLYNMTRNYMTRKPYSTEKIKVNFENPNLLWGWSLNSEDNYSGSIYVGRVDGKEIYFLGISGTRIKNKKNSDDSSQTQDEKGRNGGVDWDKIESLQKMEYQQGGDLSSNIPNLMVVNGKTVKVNGRKEKTGEYAGQNIRLEEAKCTYLPEEINRIRKCGSYLINNERFKSEDLIKFIDYYKERVIEYYTSYQFRFRDSSEYESFADFSNHVKEQAYQIQLRSVSKSDIYSLVEEGKLYLFQIYNKDFSPYSKGTPNMHTLYWKMLFDERNLADVVYKLDGQAEIFFRKSSIKYERPTHPANQPLKNKNANNAKKESTFSYDLIKDKRYTVDKFQFHVPITLNFKSVGTDNINLQVKEYLKQSGGVNVIGIDRGERHLLYVVVVDKNGNIKEQFSLNTISNKYKGTEYNTDYHALLDEKGDERNKARKNWDDIENIKELKEGYLSQAVHKVTELMVKYNAIVVLEDLNPGFKRGRQKVESQVYQKFEKMLVDKLNYLVDKKKTADEPGGLLHAYQLASKFESFKKLKGQSGFLFYVPAWNTSKIDPVTGFANLFVMPGDTIKDSKKFLEKFDYIRYNESKEWFEFGFDYKNFPTRVDCVKTKWVLCTQGERIESFRNAEKNSSRDYRDVNLTEEFKNLFNDYKIDFTDGSDLKDAIDSQEKKEFFKRLLDLLKLTLQMRNNKSNTNTDYIISPVADVDGKFYDSRSCDESLPANADANGAYNIARKGLWVVRQIRETEDLNKVKLAISNKEWLQFVQEKLYLDD